MKQFLKIMLVYLILIISVGISNEITGFENTILITGVLILGNTILNKKN